MKMHKIALALTLLTGFIASQAASANTVYWTDWSAASPTDVTGTITAGMNTVGVDFSGAYSFAQLNGAGTNYWAPNTPYLSGTVSNAPGNPDIIALNTGGGKTINFSTTVHNPLIALASWNGNVVNFAAGSNIQYLSSGCGFWGCGTYGSATTTSFVGVGELHGVIELMGDFNSITFTDTSENWHGLTIGIMDVAPNGNVPEPGVIALLGLGLVGLGLSRRKKS